MSQRTPDKWTVFAIVAIGVLMATIDSSIVNVSLPLVAASFRVPLSGPIEWVPIGYLVVVAALLLTAGRLGDVIGREYVWRVGLAVFTVASALCGRASSLEALIGCRMLQGLGGALVMAVSTAMLVEAFPSNERGRALGLHALVVGLGISIGPSLGGTISQLLGWRWIFFVNVPLGTIGVLLSAKLLGRGRNQSSGRVDVPGALLLGVGLGTLTAALSFAPELGWRSTQLADMAVASLLALLGFCLRMALARDPLVDPALFDNRVFTSATTSLLLSFVASNAVPFLLPFYLQQLRGWSAQSVGLLLTPLPLTVAIVSPATGALADRIGTRALAAGGMFLAATGLLVLSFVDERTSLLRLVVSLVVVGMGQALFRAPNNSALMGAAPRNRQGVAAGVLATARVVGQATGIATAGATFAACGGSQARLGGTAFLRGLHGALLGSALFALIASGAALVRGSRTDADDQVH